MATSNTEASFIFASLNEFIHLWRSRREASIKINCEDGKASLSFNCSLGTPDEAHIQQVQHGRYRYRSKKKSVTRVQRDNARAAAFQAAKAASASYHPPTTSPPPASTPAGPDVDPPPPTPATPTVVEDVQDVQDVVQELPPPPLAPRAPPVSPARRG